MNKTTRLAAALLLVLLITSGCAPDSQADTAAPQEIIDQEMETFIEAHAATGEFMGAALVARGDEILHSSGYGMANLEHSVPNTPQTVFRVASLTKPFTAAAVLQLQEQGLLDVNDTVDHYLPNYPHGSEITIKQLLNHTSGIPEYENLRPSMALRTPIGLKELIDVFADLPLQFPPGSQWNYNNSGYVVLTAVIEAVSEQSYADYLAQEIFQPLGMNSTGYEDVNAVLDHRAAGYTFDGDAYHNAEFLDISNIAGAGGLDSTVLDMYKWDRALYSEKVLGKTALEAFFSPTATVAEGIEYAYGGAEMEMHGRKLILVNAEINGFSSSSIRCPDEELYVVVLSNVENSVTQAVAQGLAAIALGDPYDIPGSREAVAVDPAIYETYVGSYQANPNLTLSVTVEGGRLFVQPTDEPRIEIFPESETNYFVKESDLQLHFQLDPDGMVTGVTVLKSGQEIQAQKIEQGTQLHQGGVS